MRDNHRNEEDEEMKQLRHHAKIHTFTEGNVSVLFNFAKCIDICGKSNRIADPKNLTAKNFILQEAEHKIEMFELHRRKFGRREAFFYVNSLHYVYMDIKNLFLSIFFRMEGILDCECEFEADPFFQRIDELKLSPEKKIELQKLTTIRDKLVHTLGYAKPWKKSKRLKKLTKEGLRDIRFNNDPNKQLITEEDFENTQIWVSIIEILLGIISEIKV